MLILTRKTGQSIKIGDDIELEVIGMNGHQVRLGIKAPRNVPVHREEIWDKIQKNKGVNNVR